MSRRVLQVSKTVEIFSRVEERSCDKCGSKISKNSGPDVAHEVEIFLNPEDCVNSRFRRDYCDKCLDPIWKGICKLINADPDDVSGSSFEDSEDCSPLARDKRR